MKVYAVTSVKQQVREKVKENSGVLYAIAFCVAPIVLTIVSILIFE